MTVVVSILNCSLGEFRKRLVSGNHTVKRALCDPATFSGIGSAHSDEILHSAQNSPFKLTGKITDVESERLWSQTKQTLEAWIGRL
jgi:formamidopyrimidine-DNA glycosylase